MKSPVPSENLNRRNFMQVSAAGVAGLAAMPARAESPIVKKTPGDDGLIHRNERPGMQYRKLGRTNFVASRLVFGCGAALSGGKAVRLLDQAFEAGVNFYDIGSNAYYRGSEKALAPFLKANRDQVWVSSKAPLQVPADHVLGKPLSAAQGKVMADKWTTLMEESLRDLDTDYVDAYYLMAVGDPVIVKNEEIHGAFVKARDAGKIGHFGVSTHKRAQQVLEAAVETGWYDLAMIAVTPAGWYEWETRAIAEGTPNLKELRPQLDKAREAGIGLVGMKASRFLSGMTSGGKGNETAFDSHYDEKYRANSLTAFQRSYAYVLENGLDVVNADMQNFKHFEENVVAARESHTYFA
ncbi:MAG: aldo/keto reductase [Candidatus Hydrogenedentes bacterium]|nr:aldo/keto reductase [Candidatus Hydrogenedentota bacterium]